MTEATTNTLNKKQRQKRPDLGKLADTLHAATNSIAHGTNTKADQVDLFRVALAHARAVEDLSAAVGVPREKLKLSFYIAADPKPKNNAA